MQHQRYVVDTPGVWQTGAADGRIVDDEQARQAGHHLAPCSAVGMRVIPAGGCRVRDGEVRAPSAARRNDLVRAAVGLRRHVQAVPVHGGRLRQTILHIDANSFSLAQMECRPEQSTVVAQRPRGDTSTEGGCAGTDLQREDPRAGAVDRSLHQWHDGQVGRGCSRGRRCLHGGAGSAASTASATRRELRSGDGDEARKQCAPGGIGRTRFRHDSYPSWYQVSPASVKGTLGRRRQQQVRAPEGELLDERVDRWDHR